MAGKRKGKQVKSSRQSSKSPEKISKNTHSRTPNTGSSGEITCEEIDKNIPETRTRVTRSQRAKNDGDGEPSHVNQHMQPDRPGKPKNLGAVDSRPSRRTPAQVKADKEAEARKKREAQQQSLKNAKKLKVMEEELRAHEKMREEKAVSGGYDLPSWKAVQSVAQSSEDEQAVVSMREEDDEWGGIIEDEDAEVYAPTPPQSDVDGTKSDEQFDSPPVSDSDAASSDFDVPVPAIRAGKTGKKATVTKPSKRGRKRGLAPTGRKQRTAGLTKSFKEAIQQAEEDVGGLHDSDIEDVMPAAVEVSKKAVTKNMLAAVALDTTGTERNLPSPPRIQVKKPVSRVNPTPATNVRSQATTPMSSLPPSAQPSRSQTPASGTTPNAESDSESEKAKPKRDRQNVKNLPPWMLAKWETFLATFKHRVLSSTDPMFEFKKDREKLSPVVQGVFDLVYPGTNYKVGGTAKEPVFEAAYNRACGIKNSIARSAVQQVNNEFEKREYNNKPQEIISYSKYALQVDGPMIYKAPTPRNTPALQGTLGYQPPAGVFESGFVVAVMKTQIPSLDISVAQYGRPVGGLAMACAALRRAFKDRITSGGISSKPSDRFNEETYRTTVLTYTKQVLLLRPNGSTWEQLMKAYGAGTFVKQLAAAAANNADDLDGPDAPLFIPPSPVKG